MRPVIIYWTIFFLCSLFAYSQQPQWRLAKGSEGIAIYDIDYYHPNPDTMYAKGSKWLMSTDKGETWNVRFLWSARGKLKVHPANSKILYENESSALTSSNDFFITHIDTGATKIFSGGGISSWALFVDYMDKQTVYVGVADFLLRTTEGYKDVKNITPLGGRVGDIAIASSNDSILVAVCEGDVYKSTTKGENWTSIRYGGVPYCVAIHPANPDIIAVGYRSYGAEPRGLQMTTDGGITWNPRYNGIDTTNLFPDPFTIYCITFNPRLHDNIFVSVSSTSQSSQGIYQTDDLGLNWNKFNTGLPINPGISSIIIDTINNRMYAGMYTSNPSINGVYIYDGKPTSVGGEHVKIPTQYSLSQNYPNPFNPTTTINYALPRAGNTVLKVYDILGKEVATLVNNYKEYGRYMVEFDASKLSSGMYIYKLTADKFSEVKKMMLVK